MQIPLEITFRDVEKTQELEELIRRKAAKLDKIFDHINSCRVIVEKLQKHQSTGQPYRVRLDIKIPPGHELVVSRDPSKGNLHLDVATEIRWAFEAAARQIKELVARLNGDVKVHPHQQVQGIIEKIFFNEDAGFIRTVDGREIFFHKNSLLRFSFDQLRVGMGVRFAEEMGEKGPQATSVQIIEIPESY
ncbi:MAG TPA: HPF/RaiA family ribosome-associated protein [Chitinispirillaceae bacterium]|nr:HPF/RaiA family ribosome-associated protein [Chitinispirillaceae bacterium]